MSTFKELADKAAVVAKDKVHQLSDKANELAHEAQDKIGDVAHHVADSIKKKED